jgi:citronellol/citronellal dehydrogenase
VPAPGPDGTAQDINVRGTFLLTKACLPHLRQSSNAHVVTIAPPLNLNPYWLGAHPSYTLSKYGMTLLSLGWAAEYAEANIGFSCLWPQTYIATTAVANSAGAEAMLAASRSTDIMADSAVAIVSRAPSEVNGHCYVDVDVLAEAGVTDLSQYGGGSKPILDIFVDPPERWR